MLVSMMRRLGCPSAVLSQRDMSDCHRLSHVLQVVTDHEWRTAIKSCPIEPVLTMYMSDGWGGDVRSTTAAWAGAHLVLRRGKLRHEFLLQRIFFEKMFLGRVGLHCREGCRASGVELGERSMAGLPSWLRLPGDAQGTRCYRDYDFLLPLRRLPFHSVGKTLHS
jgi:hypothetical protein